MHPFFKLKRPRSRIQQFFLIASYLLYATIVTLPNMIVDLNGNIIDPQTRRVFDCVIYNSESYMLYNRIWRLDPYVDHFIVLYSRITHSGLPNNISFAPFEKEIKSYSHKVHFYEIDIRCEANKDEPWCRENNQRKYLLKFLKQFKPRLGDLVIISDIDEMPTRKGLKWMMDHPPVDYYNYKCYMTNYGYTHRYPDLWGFPFVVYYSDELNEEKMNSYRFGYQYHTKEALGTHCSSCFRDLETYVKKYNSFAHQELHKYPYINTSYMFWSHYCKRSMPWAKQLIPLNYSELEFLVPPHPLMDYLTNPQYTLDITKTIYKKEELPKLCTAEYDWWVKPHEELNPRYKL